MKAGDELSLGEVGKCGVNVTSLADKSLVVPEQEDAQTRYRLLETVRQYAREKLLDAGDGEAIVGENPEIGIFDSPFAPGLVGVEHRGAHCG
mgnify:CR=1 FL=1